jgi:beta-lactamase regulating signal transducer with metallopeptidase domain
MINAAREVLDILLATLWQGACIALVAGALLAFAGRSLNALTRCIILQCVLVAMLLVPFVAMLPNALSHRATVASQQPPVESTVTTARPAAQLSVTHEGDTAVGAQRIQITPSERLVFVLTGLWIAGVFCFGLRIAVGAMQLARLVRRSTRLPDRGRVRLYASPDLTMPLAFGLFAPAIVVPAAFAAKGGEEFECILQHELAHIRRHDQRANACERVVQALFFCNPAVWFVLRAIALERETACDDWAATQSRDRDTYTRSLASFAVWGADYHDLTALGATGFGHAIVTRLRRLEDSRRNHGITLARYTLGGCTTVLFSIVLMFAMFAPSIALEENVAAVSLPATVPNRCPSLVPGGKLPNVVPAGLRTAVDVNVSPKGTIPKLVISSGNARFDRVAVDGAQRFMIADEEINCDTQMAGTFHMTVESGAISPRTKKTSYRWTIMADRMKKPVVLGCLAQDSLPRVVQAAVPAERGIAGQVQVVVSLDRHSRVIGTPTIRKSSASALNQAAIDAAKASKFATEISGCTPRAMKFVYVVQFDSRSSRV